MNRPSQGILPRRIGRARSAATLLTAAALLLVPAALPAANAQDTSPPQTASLSGVVMILTYDSPISDSPVLNISGSLPDNVPLPATITLPIAEGASIRATQEFLGTETEPAAVSHELVSVNGVTAVRFTLSRSRVGMVEMIHPGAVGASEQAEGASRVTAQVIMPVDASSVYTAISLPANAEVVAAPPQVDTETAEDGLVYYSQEQANVTAGSIVGFSLDVLPAGRAATDRASLMVIGVFAAVALAAAILWVTRRRGSAAGS